MLPHGTIYTMKYPREKEDKEGQKEWPDRLEEGREAELTGEPIWQRGFDAVKLRLVFCTKLHFSQLLITCEICNA